MFRISALLSVAWLAIVFLPGCGRDSSPSQEKIYDITGKVVEVKKNEQTFVLDHEAIPGLMKAMQMPFKVADPQMLEGLQPGTQIHGKLNVKGGTYLLKELHKM